jgi:hypothetical protein
VIPALKKYSSSEEPENFDEFISLLSNCSISAEIDFENVEDELRRICHIDDETSEFCQQCILEEVDDMIKLSEKGEVAPEEDPDEFLEEPENDVELLDIPTVDFNQVINQVMSLTNPFSELQESGIVPSEAMYRCMDDLYRLQTSIKRANSAIQAIKINNSKQMTLHDCFPTQ